MLLEKVKFLEEAIRNVREELLEEADALEEGNDNKIAASAIRKIVNTLLEETENYGKYQVEENVETKEDIETEENEKKHSVRRKRITTSSFEFEIGDVVEILNKDWKYHPSELLNLTFGYSVDYDGFYDKEHLLDGAFGEVIERKVSPYDADLNVYIIEVDVVYTDLKVTGTNTVKFFVVENDLVLVK